MRRETKSPLKWRYREIDSMYVCVSVCLPLLSPAPPAAATATAAAKCCYCSRGKKSESPRRRVEAPFERKESASGFTLISVWLSAMESIRHVVATAAAAFAE